MPSLFDRLKQRKLVQWAVAYAAAAWVTYEVLLAIGGVFDWPTPLLRVITVLLGVGFVAVLVVGWHHGESGRQRVTAAELATLAGLGVVAVGLSWWAARGGEPASARTASFQPEPNTVAVLPCANIGGDEDNSAFVDGVHNDILTHLSKISGVTPISRTSVMEYRGVADNLRRIAEALNVATIMECSVQRAGGAVRISAQLVDARTDGPMWAEEYDRELTTQSLFAIQAQVAENVARALAAQLTGVERRRIEKPLTDNLEAYELYVRSRQYLDETWEELVAIQMLDQAIELDPEFAAAHARLSTAHSALYWYLARWNQEVPGAATAEEHCEWAKEAIERALELDPDEAEAHTSEAWYQYRCNSDYGLALAALEKAEQLTPNSVEILEPKSIILRRIGRFDDSVDVLDRAIELSPRYADLRYHLVSSYAVTGRFDEAHDQFERAVSLRPGNSAYYSVAAAAALRAGNLARARDVLARAQAIGAVSSTQLRYRATVSMLEQRYTEAVGLLSVMEADPESPQTLVLKAEALRLAGESEAARAHADSARVMLEEVLRAEPGDYAAHRHLSRAYRGLGQDEDAIREAEKAVELAHAASNALDGLLYLQSLAEVCAAVGEHDRAITTLEKLVTEQRYLAVARVEIDPAWDPLRDDPRFQALLEREERRSQRRS
jgi:TolB-like protein/Tfp pilus assembly protein PilF